MGVAVRKGGAPHETALLQPGETDWAVASGIFPASGRAGRFPSAAIRMGPGQEYGDLD